MAGHQRTLSAYLDGELTAREQRKLEKALAQDPALRAELDELRRTVEMVRSLPALAAPRSFTLDPAVYGRVKPRRFYLYPVMRAATAVAVLVFALLFAGDVLLMGSATAPAQEVQTLASEVTQEVEKEVVITEVVEMEQPMAMEVAEEPAVEPPAETLAEYDEAVEERGLEEPAEVTMEMAAEAVEETAPEAESGLNATAEGTEPAASPPPIAEPGEGGASAGGGVPTATVTSQPLPTDSPSGEATEEIMSAVPAQDASPTVLPTETLPAPVAKVVVAPTPTGVDLAEPTATHRQPETVRDRGPEVDWALMGKFAVGILAVGLLVVTLLARRFNW